MPQELQDEGVELTPKELNFIPIVSSSHFLLFATGATNIPTTGFHPVPNVMLVHDDTKKIPSAQTCANTLYLYVNQNTIENSIARDLLTVLINGGVFSKL